MAPPASPPKKRKAEDSNSNNDQESNHKKPNNNSSYEPLSLSDIRSRIIALQDRVPAVDETALTSNHQIHDWAAQLQAVIEEFNLLLSCISAATYRWGSDRSGAADQNLSLLSGELAASQEQISATVTPRLTNILAPVVDLVIEKTIITTDKASGKKMKTNHFVQKQVDPEFLDLCREILRRNATLIRQVVLANFTKIATCISDFLQAQEKDSQHDSRGFAY